MGSYQGVSTIQGFSAHRAFVHRFDTRNLALQTTILKRTALRTVISPILSFSTGVSVFLILYLGGSMSIAGQTADAARILSTGELVAFITLVALLAGPLRGLSFLLAIVKQAQASLERINDVMAPEPDRPDLPTPISVGTHPPQISIQGLTFSYPGSDSPVLSDVSIEIRSGTTLGVFGPTGAGKSTLLHCVSRLYNPPVGTIQVDGIDIRSLDLEQWRANSVLVPQRPFLFSETVWENISLDVYDRSLAAAITSLTALTPDVGSFTEGLDTQVGESGVMLSGGQRQRIALARGLIRTPKLLILDDVLSAVDHRTEHELIRTLRDSGTSPTTIIVAHRISALQHAESIVVLEHGRVVDQGTHEELVQRPGLYRDTWSKQREVGYNEAS